MKQSTKQQVSSLLLMLAFLPMLLISSVHTHNHHNISHADAECSKCIQHLPCAGHLDGEVGHSHDCVLCQFVGLNYVATNEVRIAFVDGGEGNIRAQQTAHWSACVVGLPLLRAPPVALA
ncbi:MAG: hypothetical protein IKR17_04465 [Bacteroidales bacterium]|nr:hypothetical protein [Bacteroidales bacterium]